MTRKCPHCGEEIREEAIFCRFCRRDIEQPIWMSTLQKCPFCAEWIEIGLDDCPLCGKRLEENKEAKVFTTSEPVYPQPKDPDALIASLRREAHPEDAPAEEPEPDIVLPPEMPEIPGISPSESMDDEWARSVESSPIHSVLESSSSRIPGLRKRRVDPEASGIRPISELIPDDEAAATESPIHGLPTIVRRIISLLLIIGLGVGLIALIVGPGKQFVGALLTPEPTATKTITPTTAPMHAATLPPVESETPTSEVTTGPGDCVYWDQVSLSNADETMCVYGPIRRWFASGDIPFVAIFSETYGSFAFVDYETGHPEIRPGDCIIGTGPIEIMRGTRPFIDITGAVEKCPEELQ
jgi:hypothetical protein